MVPAGTDTPGVTTPGVTASYADLMPGPGSRRGRLVALTGMLAAAVGLGCAGFVRSAARGHLYGEDDAPITPVALLLGAQVYPDGTPSPFLAARLDVARRLFEHGKVATVLVSGDANAVEYNEPAAMRRYLVRAGVPADRVIEDHSGFDTYESCLRARETFGLSRVTLVSQAYHLPRAVGTARRLGLEAVGVGDYSVRTLPSGRHSRTWRLGALRDLVACVKTVRDLLTRPQPSSDQEPT